MSQFTQLLTAIDNSQTQMHNIIMATVVSVEGSAYRRPGARMLIMPYGQSVGMISGGCLEQEVCKKADWLTRINPFAVQRYSTGSIEQYHPNNSDFEQIASDDEMMAFGLGCNGKVTVLFERLSHPCSRRMVEHIKQVQMSQRAGVIATVIAAPHQASLSVGDRIFLDPVTRELEWLSEHDSSIQANPLLTQHINQEISFILTHHKSTQQAYQTDNGIIEIFFEYIAAPNRLVIFGAGHDAQPLVTLAKMQGWYVTVVDSRSHFAKAQRFPDADQVLYINVDQPYDLKDLTKLTNGAATAIMSHSLTQDRYWLNHLLLNPPRYIGQLGPRYRTERLIAEISQQLPDISQIDNGLEVLHYPIGLDIGGDTPESIALAIMAEMTACLNQRTGKMLKQRTVSIHAE